MKARTGLVAVRSILKVKRARPVAGDLQSLTCIGCGKALNVHQPVFHMPERLLATCPACGEWYLLIDKEDAKESILISLPSPEEFAEKGIAV